MNKEIEQLIKEREYIRKCMKYQSSKLEKSKDLPRLTQRFIEGRYAEYSLQEIRLTNQINGLRDGVVETLTNL